LRQWHRCASPQQRPKLATFIRLTARFRPVFCLFIISLGLFGCRSSPSPNAVFQNIRAEMRRGQLDAALRDSDRAYNLYSSKDSYWAASFRVLKAHVLVLRGSDNEALQLLAPALPSSAARSDVAVHGLMVQGLAYIYLQQFDAADHSLTQAEQLGISIHSSLLGDVAQSRGVLEENLKRYPEAAAAFHRALSIARQQNLPFLEVLALGNLGNIAMRQEHYDQAIDLFKIALEKARAVGSLSSESLALGNMGWNYLVVGDYDSAESVLKQAETDAAQSGKVAERVYWLQVLGEVYYRQYRYADADAVSLQALQLARNLDDKRTLTECLDNLSNIALATGRLDLAQQYNHEALAIEHAGLDRFSVLYSTLIEGRIAAGNKDFSRAEKIFKQVLADPSAETPLRWQARAFSGQLYAGEHRDSQAEAEFRSAISSIEAARSALHREEFRLSFLTSAIEFYQAYVDFLVSRGRSLDALSVADFSRAQSLEESFSQNGHSSAAYIPRLHPQSIAARFHSTLLFYWLGTPHFYLWLITPQRTVLFPLPSRTQIDALVDSYRQAITESPLDPLNDPNSPGAKLYSLLVAPAAKFISRNSRLIVLPDGSLDTFNFETLIVPSPQPHYWIEDVTLTNADSLTLLARAKSASAPHNASLLLVGNPAPADSAFPPLPQAPTEIQDVEQYFASTHRDVITGPAATPAAYFESNPSRFQFLHFVTHGTASRLQPLESAVILSPYGDSYKLYARDIIDHPLHAYLVTISACNGAGNRAYAGEGLVGLSWAFLRAGAHQVISALWEVSDVSTPQLMNSLYHGLSRGEDPATALRNAKLGLLHSSSIYKKPFYWAPFQLYSGS
jgi:CHAT domain-containing protein